jgi:CheY-like chemotaxis protein
VARILVADDNSNIQKMVGLALKDQGIDVVAVGNGEAAVRKISDVRPDLVLADVFMPVRNGYEVCRYVKQDSALSHIPVILLVGAFDPLDEQEAQRVGADGVLKKPFVPPDPLISMVKSALTRAGVVITAPGATPSSASDRPPVPLRMNTDILANGGVGSKVAPPASAAPQKLPEAVPEPIEEFPELPAAQVKIAEGQGPVAFGNLLDSPEPVDDPAMLSAKPMIELAKPRDWDEEGQDVAEEGDDEEAPSGGWHPSGLEEVDAVASGSKSVPDWRDEAFHGSSPAKSLPSAPWAPTKEKTEFVEAAATEAVAVSTLEPKPSSGASPFNSEAWASALAAGVEEKIAHGEVKVPGLEVTEPQAPTSSNGSTASASLPAVESAPVIEKKVEIENLPAVPETSWEAEAKRASSLASTWDAAPPAPPAPTPAVAQRSPDETQDVPVYVAEQPSAETEKTEEIPAVSPYSGNFESEQTASVEAALPQKIDEPATEGTLPKAWGNNWETPAPLNTAAPTLVSSETQAQPDLEIPPSAPEPLQQPSAYAAEPDAALAASTTEPARANTPDMDELVARVLSKMNPDVLQKVTREILKPVIEAIVRDELETKN